MSDRMLAKSGFTVFDVRQIKTDDFDVLREKIKKISDVTNHVENGSMA